MTSLLDDVNRLLEIKYGDIERLQKIKDTLEKNRMLFVSERQYLCRLTQEKPEKPLSKTRNYVSKESSDLTEDEMNLDELEEKIRVEEEPS